MPLVGETRNVIFRPLNAECRLFDVDMLTPLIWILKDYKGFQDILVVLNVLSGILRVIRDFTGF